MSIRALNWATDMRVGASTAKFVLVALANYADEEGTCFPSVSMLMADTELSRRAVAAAIKRLGSAGLLVTERQRLDDGSLGRNRYHLQLKRKVPLSASADGYDLSSNPEPCAPDAHGEQAADHVHETTSPCAPHDPPCAPGAHPYKDKPPTEPSIEPSTLRESASARAKEGGKGDQADGSTSGGTTSAEPVAPDQGPTAPAGPAFASFKSKWPFKVSGSWPKAKKAWDGLSAEDRQAAIDGIDPYMALLEREGQTHGRAASTYLKEALWKEVAGALEADPLPYAPPSAKPSSPLWWAMVIEHLRRGDAWRAVCCLRGLETHELVSLRFGQERDAELVAMAADFDRFATHHDQWRRWKAWMTQRILANPKREGRLAMFVRNGRVPWLDALPVSAQNPYWLSMPSEALCRTLEIDLPDVDATGDVREKPESEEDRVAFAQAVLAKARAAQQPDAKPPTDDETAWT